jgi:hypothetical protein
MKIGLLELLMGVETPMPPKMMNAAAPDGAPPRRIKTVEKIICRFSWLGCEPDRFMLVSPEQFFFKTVERVMKKKIRKRLRSRS